MIWKLDLPWLDGWTVWETVSIAHLSPGHEVWVGRNPCHNLCQSDAEGEDVSLLTVTLAFEQLRGHPVRGPHRLRVTAPPEIGGGRIRFRLPEKKKLQLPRGSSRAECPPLPLKKPWRGELLQGAAHVTVGTEQRGSSHMPPFVSATYQASGQCNCSPLPECSHIPFIYVSAP